MIRASGLLLLCLLAAPPLGAQELGRMEMSRTWALERKGDLFTAKIRDVLTSARVKSFSVGLDWWNGGEDDRVGDRAKAEREKYRVEVKHGKVWLDLGEVTRDLRLEAAAASPEGVLAGEAVRGEWNARVVGGKEKPERAWLTVTFDVPFGKGLAQPDLAVRAIRFPDLEKDPPAAGTFPEKRDFPKLLAGKTYDAKVHVENRGYGDVRKADFSFAITDAAGKGRKTLPPLEIDVPIREQEDLRASWELPVPKGLKPGLYRLHAVSDPGGRVKELDEANNEYSRVVRIVEPED